MEIMIIIFWIFCSIVAGTIASSKNRSAFGWFVLAFFVGPFAWAVALLPSLEKPAPVERKPEPAHEVSRAVALNDRISTLTKTCPACGETIKTRALKCRFCGEAFAPERVKALVIAQFEKMAIKENGMFKWCPKCKKWDATIAPLIRMGLGGMVPQL
ncbi:hypothetical protein [Desulforhabdus sp. TSK]|uniref:hypothetical protein n=1 Tax=Desulforhabdus sp. TSK TaxID=2925014 RepID=UPI001FC8B0E9|nr:hypothetical protein [Desulforhabdus sp. TSK]GKT07468.1 hypothetical protein DSTSK_07730 [Desulforhabdus sp. TSK]